MIQLHKNDALYQQIASFYEKEIAEGRLIPGDRLPPTVTLAQQLKVNPDTIQQSLKLLVTRGLLERVPGRGTFIRKGINNRIVGIIFCKELFSDRDVSFYGVFLEKLIAKLEKSGWSCRLFLTGRNSEYDAAFHQMKHAIEKGEIRALIEFCSNPFVYKWIETECPIPYSQVDLNIDYQTFTNTGLDYLLAHGCHHIAYLGVEWEKFGNLFQNQTDKFCRNRKIDSSTINVIQCTAHYSEGYNAVSDMLKKNIKFDGLLSANDTVFQGALYALMEHGIKIPEQVKLLTYANQGLDIFCHLPLTKLQVNPVMAVNDVYNEIMAKVEGRKYLPAAIEPVLITGKSCGE